MKIFNSNSSNALIQDLGPFRAKSANLSINGKIKLEYETYSQSKTIGSQTVYGRNTNHVFLLRTSNPRQIELQCPTKDVSAIGGG